MRNAGGSRLKGERTMKGVRGRGSRWKVKGSERGEIGVGGRDRVDGRNEMV